MRATNRQKHEAGYGLIRCQRYPSDPRTDADLYGEALELAEEAERLSFDFVWTSDSEAPVMPSVFLCDATHRQPSWSVRSTT